MTIEARKDALRARFLAGRAQLTTEEWAADNAARSRRLLDDLATHPVGTVALYASRPDEPDTRVIGESLLALGWRVLLPVLDRTPRWAPVRSWDDLRAGRMGIPEPAGEPLPPGALAGAATIVVPCLAVGRDGSRLGTGGGWYDRALVHRAADARIIALARDAEIVDALPTLSHDVAVDGYVTERVSVRLRS
ncbi:5-formyltetrahydrofolate cyclo-ligase [Tessaracoccus lapidicaptus]|uniref:5-formyltetrahydrofolate cyclo-ligase n=1 Tax=Tessaracoccus lapidicaptus TaxID=1427523 RepID=UPI0033406558